MIFLWVISGISGGLLLLFIFVYLNNNLLKTTRYELVIKGLSEEIKIIHLSDLHGKSFGRGNRKLIDKINKENPDFIAVTGDIIHKYREKDERVAIDLVRKLCETAPVIYVSGNHEMRSKKYAPFRAALIEAGADVLDDCTRDICGLTVVGLNCASLKNDKIFTVMPDEGVRILLAHMPEYIDKYAESGCDAVLCGHAHGGQWRIPFTGIGIYSPGQGVFPKLTSGVHKRGNMREVISRGLGNSRCPLRLFNPPEIVAVSLKKQ